MHEVDPVFPLSTPPLLHLYFRSARHANLWSSVASFFLIKNEDFRPFHPTDPVFLAEAVLRWSSVVSFFS